MPEISCPTEFPDPFKCPTKEEYLIQLLALLPRGRAWQSHEKSSTAIIKRYPDSGPAELGELILGEAQLGQPAIKVERTVMAAYWASYAEVCEGASRRACELLAEFFCHSINETEDWWATDYGFPDPCEPWDNLCDKVAALGGSTCDYLVWAAARRGWSITCTDCGTADPKAVAGCTLVGPWAQMCFDCQPDTINIAIDVLNSPAYVAFNSPAYAGVAMAGCTSLCEPDPQQIECLVERIKPAHVAVAYTYIDKYQLESRGLRVGSPTLGTPGVYLEQLEAVPLTVGSPTIGTPDFTSLAALSLTVGSPILGTPTLTEI